MKPETFSRRTTGYGLRPVSSTFITRNSGLSFSSLTTATTHRVTSRFRRTNTANGNSASCITQKTFCLRQPVPTATVLPSYRRPLPLTLQMTSTKPSKLLTTPLRPQATLTCSPARVPTEHIYSFCLPMERLKKLHVKCIICVSTQNL